MEIWIKRKEEFWPFRSPGVAVACINWYNGSAVGLHDGTASRCNVKGHRCTGSSINRVALYLGKFFAEFRFNEKICTEFPFI